MTNKKTKNRKKTVIETSNQPTVVNEIPSKPMIVEPHIEARQYEALITVELPIDQIILNSENPRIITDDSEVSGLIADIAKNGLIHPISVRKLENGKYQIIAGERRYRACKALKYENISCIVKEFDDEQAIDVMMSENLMRENLKPLDEAKKYQALIWAKQYTIKEIAARFNQSESHVYNRIALLNMITEIADLVNNEVIGLSVANEICKFPFSIQREVYENHLKNDDHRNWQQLSAKAFKKKLEENYSTCLSEYHFDKKACKECTYNSEYLSMFPSEKSYCKNFACLQKLQADYVVTKTIELAKENPGVEINIPPTVNMNTETVEQFSQLGIAVLKEYSKDLPQAPQAPKEKEYKCKADYKIALSSFENKEKQYLQNVSKLEKDLEEGKAKFVIDLQAKDPVVRYVNVTNAAQGKKSEAANTKNLIDELKNQDQRNQVLRTQNINKELAEFLRKSENPSVSLHETENILLLYILLHKLRYQNQKLLKTDVDIQQIKSFKVCQSLTDEQKNTIVRDVIIDFATNHPSDKNELMAKYMELHFPEKLKEISKRYTDVYNSRHKKIEEKLKILMSTKTKNNGKTIKEKPAKQIANASDRRETPVIPMNEKIKDVDYIEEELFGNVIEQEPPFDNEIPEQDNTKEEIEEVDYIRETLPERIIYQQEPIFDEALTNVPVIINQQPYYY